MRVHTQHVYKTIRGHDTGATAEHECKCGETFETLDELKDHAEENHPDLYEEKFE